MSCLCFFSCELSVPSLSSLIFFPLTSYWSFPGLKKNWSAIVFPLQPVLGIKGSPELWMLGIHAASFINNHVIRALGELDFGLWGGWATPSHVRQSQALASCWLSLKMKTCLWAWTHVPFHSGKGDERVSNLECELKKKINWEPGRSRMFSNWQPQSCRLRGKGKKSSCNCRIITQLTSLCTVLLEWAGREERSPVTLPSAQSTVE